MISQCLQAVFRQKIDCPIEVIIIDSESEDKTLALAAKFPVKIISLKRKNFSYGKALNLGSEAAAGKYLVFLSAHALPLGFDWLATLLSNFKKEKVAGVCSKEIPFSDCNPLTRRQLLAHNQKILKTPEKYFSFSNAGSAILKNVWQKIKFNEKLIAVEDYDWGKRVKAQGYQIIYEPKAVISHSHNESPKQIFNRYFREFYALLLIEEKKISLTFLILGLYYFYQDTKYVLKNRYSLIWIIRSAVSNLLLFFAALAAIFNRLKNVKQV